MKILTFLAFCGLVAAQNRQQFHGNSGSAPSNLSDPYRYNDSPRMTSKLAKALNSLTSVEEFLKMIDKGQNGQKTFFIANRFGDEERSNRIVARPAICMPELKTVPLDTDNNDSAVFYFPSCTRIKRCNGCCQALFSCQPKETIERNFEVIVSRLMPDGTIQAEERKIIPMIEHVRCQCDCKMKPEHCHVKHIYNEEFCECKCKNTDEEEKCDRDRAYKYWDPTTCSCHCMEEATCNIGWRFNPDSCRCERRQISSVFGNRRETDYRYPPNSKSRDNLPDTIPPEIDSRRRSNKDDPEYKNGDDLLTCSSKKNAYVKSLFQLVCVTVLTQGLFRLLTH